MAASDAFLASTKLRRVDGVDAVVFYCPGCRKTHQVMLAGPTHWTAEGQPDRPTFWPSIKVTTPAMLLDDICHSFITLGRIAFQADSTHDLAGKTVEMPAWPYPRGKYGGIIEPPKRQSG